MTRARGRAWHHGMWRAALRGTPSRLAGPGSVNVLGPIRVTHAFLPLLRLRYSPDRELIERRRVVHSSPHTRHGGERGDTAGLPGHQGAQI